MADWMRNLLYPFMIIAIVASLWAYAQAEALQSQIQPSLPPQDPDLVEQIWGPGPYEPFDPATLVATIPVND